MKDCSHFSEFLKRSLFEESGTEERRHLEAHLQACPSCRTERARVEKIKAGLAGWEELPVPRNFYLYDDPQSARRLFSTGTWLPLAASLLVLFMAGVLFWANVQVTYGEGVVAVGFGEGKIRESGFTSDRVEPAVQQALAERNEIWKRLVRESVVELLSEREERWNDRLTKALLEMESRLEAVSEMQARLEAVSGMEQRLSERMASETQQLRVDLESSMASLYESVQWQYQRDLYPVIAQTNRLVLAEMQQSRRTDALASALVTLANVQAAYPSEATDGMGEDQ